MLSFFHVPLGHLYCFFGKMSIQFCQYFNQAFLILICMSCLYILEINPLSVVSFAIIFSHSEGCLFTLLIVFFVVQKLFKFTRAPLVYFGFYFHYSRRWIIEDIALIYVIEYSAYVFLLEFYSF